MTKEGNEDCKSSTKCCFCGNYYVDKVRDHCNITKKYAGSAHKDCNNNLKLNKKTPVVFSNIKNCDSHLIMQQELDKLNLKINVIPNGLEKYMGFITNNKLRLTASNF